MTKDEALKLALEALQSGDYWKGVEAVNAIREALAQPEQKYRRGDRLVCLETDEYCVIHIAGTDRQWVKFPDTHIGVYTNEQLDQLFEKLARETDSAQPEQEPVAWMHPDGRIWTFGRGFDKSTFTIPLYTTPSHRKPLTDDEIDKLPWEPHEGNPMTFAEGLRYFARAIEAAHGIKE